MVKVEDKGYSYLLFPKKYNTEDNNAEFKNVVDMLYYYLNRGVPTEDMAEPIICTQSMVDEYGLENLVMNMQRKFKYDFDIIVVKVPQEYLRMEQTHIMADQLPYEPFDDFDSKILPIKCRYQFNKKTQYMISADYIESVYLRYPDCRRVINDNWKVVSPDTMGMILTPEQYDQLAIMRRSKSYSQFGDRENLMDDMDLTTRQMCDLCKNDKSKQDKYGHSPEVIDFIQKKYGQDNKIYNCYMTKSRIENILMVERQRQDKRERFSFVGE